MHCRLLIPDLLLPGLAPATACAPRLELVLARGRRRSAAWPGFEAWLLEAFEVAKQEDWPSAPFEVLGGGRAPGDAFWTHAQPMQWQAEGGNVQHGETPLVVDAAEAQAFADAINAHFGDALQVTVLEATRWYARVAEPPSGAPVPPWELGGRLRDASAPLAWHRLMNEIQMLLHDHPLNEAREARGAAPINGLWFWGGGRLATPTAPALRSIVSSEPLATGLAQSAGLRHARVPERIDHWLESAGEDGVHLFVLDALMVAAASNDAHAWREALSAMESRIVAPLVDALRASRIGMLTVQAGGSDQLLAAEVTRSDLRHFWRRPRPLAAWAKLRRDEPRRDEPRPGEPA